MAKASTDRVIQAYKEWFGEPSSILHLDVNAPPATELAVVVYVLEDGKAITTQLGTAGLSVGSIGQGFKAEVGMEVSSALGDSDAQALSEALVDLARAPFKTGRPFQMNQILTNVALPLFPRFRLALLADWDPVYGFKFPSLEGPVSLLRVVPLFDQEAKFIEASAKRTEAYLHLYNLGLRDVDPDRKPVL